MKGYNRRTLRIDQSNSDHRVEKLLLLRPPEGAPAHGIYEYVKRLSKAARIAHRCITYIPGSHRCVILASNEEELLNFILIVIHLMVVCTKRVAVVTFTDSNASFVLQKYAKQFFLRWNTVRRV